MDNVLVYDPTTCVNVQGTLELAGYFLKVMNLEEELEKLIWESKREK